MRLIDSTKQAAAEAAADVTATSIGFAEKLNARSTRAKAAFLATFLTGYYAIFASTSFAAPGGAGCDSDAAARIVDFLDSVGKFVLIIVGALAGLVFLIGAAFVVGGANNEGRVRTGMKMMKNALIGLIAVAAAGVVQWLVLDVVAGGTGEDTDRCLQQGQQAVGGVS